MRLLFLGDTVGRPGREAAMAALPGLRQALRLDFIVVNVENAAAGYGVTPEICGAMFEAGADAVTLGNHAFDQKEIRGALDAEPRIVKPLNWPRTPGHGASVIEGRNGHRVLVTNLLGRIFMTPLDDPFSAVDALLREHRMGEGGLDAILVDMHAEATSEKMAMGHWIDGRATLVVGTHTHVPTADAQILKGGTGYMSDAGMCGVYDSVIGMDKVEPLKRFITGLSGRAEPASGEADICGVVVETNPSTGLCARIGALRQGSRLAAETPRF